MVVKQLKKLKNFLGMATGLISLSYFSTSTLAMNLTLGSETNLQEDQTIEELQKTVNDYRDISSMTVNLFFTFEETEKKTNAYDYSSQPSKFFNFNLPEIVSAQPDQLLAIFISQKSLPSKATNAISEQKSKFLGQNLFVYIADKFKELQQSPNVAILPRFNVDKAFEDISYFDVHTSENQENLNYPLQTTNKSQSTPSESASENISQNLLSKNFLDSEQEDKEISHDALNHQLVRSVIYNQYYNPIEKDPNDQPIVVNTPRIGNWFYYFDKAQQETNPQGLLDYSTESYAARQLKSKQEIDARINERTNGIKTIIQGSF